MVSDPLAAATALLAWYDKNARVLPWRAPPAARKKTAPYRVWLSEVMLQQTTVPAVIPYFERFTERWPTVDSLAATPLDDLLAAWAGLGYYARARNLHKCATVVAQDHNGKFPTTSDGLRELPGIGPYTAAAIAAIAFDEPATVVDGNVERVMARIFAITDPMPGSKPALRAAAATLTPPNRAGDYAQAVMDLGATVCTPRKPKCLICPWIKICAAHKAGIAETLPSRDRDKAKPIRTGRAYWLQAPHPETGELSVLLTRRPDKGLLGAMLGFPTEGWDANGPVTGLPKGNWQSQGEVRHTFTHFHLILDVLALNLDHPTKAKGIWCPLPDLKSAGLPTIMRKIAKLASA
ncbi:A/G-specific adenine glycosylase [Govanella unica]|uniref:Adenine DNA glycosylase n=1 Tax=Govanella unica TaxID=2975056 RepID=A0A9X3TX69_9PROT|nr:A/G-specific adenine glycosylase [Govania unica]MDA5193378.1 A/G-specific adenine glycosylase [Govania unica]